MIYIIFLFYFYSKQEPITFLSYFNKQINESRTGYERNPGNPNEKLLKKTGMIFSADRTFYIGLCATALSGKPWKRIRQLNHGEEVWE